MSKTERLYHLHNILNARRTPISRHQLMEELGCSQATLYRLINELRDYLGAPIEQDEESRFYYDRSLAGHFELPGIWISPQELQALLTAQQVLGNVQPGLLEDELGNLQGRIANLLTDKGVEMDGGRSRIHIHQAAGRPVPARMFQDVLQALLQRHRLQIRYHGRGSDEVTERAVSPERLTYYRNAWYLDAWCHLRKGLRSFALERIRDQQLQDEPARDVTPEELAQHYDQSYGIFSGQAEDSAELKFSPRMARWVADEQWHPDQSSEWQEDGSYLLSVPFSNARELVMDILRFGPEVEVMGPESLRRSVAEAAAATSRIYTD